MSEYEGHWSFHAWLELPYLVFVEHTETFTAEYRPDANTEVQLRLRNDLVKIVTGNWWERERAIEEWARRARAGEEVERPNLVNLILYAPKVDLKGLIEELEREESVSYPHVEKLQTVVELSGEVPDSLVPEPVEEDVEVRPLNPDLIPSGGFFNEQVLPRLGRIINAYRIATLPAKRFKIHPVSEALVPQALIEVREPDEKVHQVVRFGYDPKGAGRFMGGHADRLDVQSRFENALANLGNLQPEEHLAASYYLYHMRRWTEAVVVASAVVDELLQEVVYNNASEELADVLWKSHRHRFKDAFNKVLPALGLPKLSQIDTELWTDFCEAKSYRGSVAHGAAARAFDATEAQEVKAHLIAIYGVARWLSDQLGRDWSLDLEDEDGQLLRPFP